MNRRIFLSLLPLLTSTVLASDGLLIDDDVGRGLLIPEAPMPADGGLLIDSPEPKAADEQKPGRKVVWVYSPDFVCPACIVAAKMLSADERIDLRVSKGERPAFFANMSYPVIHWGAGNDWIEGWPGKEAALLRIFPPSRLHKPTITNPLDMTRRAGDWTWPGNLASHLCNAHGYCGDAIPKTGRGMIELHNRLHETGTRTTSRRKSFLGLFEWE